VTDTFAKRKVTVNTKPEPQMKLRLNWAYILYGQIVDARLETPIREYHFDEQARDGRGWALDLAWPHFGKCAVEVNGAVHSIKANRLRDVDKMQAAMMDGWRVLVVTPTQVKNGTALDLVRQMLATWGAPEATHRPPHADAAAPLPLPWATRV